LCVFPLGEVQESFSSLIINAYKILVGKPEGRTKCKWEDNIKINLEVSCEDVD
jgi:hypothetical protein